MKLSVALLLLGCLAFIMPTFVVGQKANPKTVAASFGGECKGTKYNFSAQLKKLISQQRQLEDTSCDDGGWWCENAFAYDLNGDGRKEFFVRLRCGGTGNCLYGIFSNRPAKLLGTFTAWFFFIHKRTGSWSRISTYTRVGGSEGVITFLNYRRQKYYETAGRTERVVTGRKTFYERMGLPDCP
jgi:hypothetical protein